VRHIEQASDGWFIELDNGSAVHLTADWAEDIYDHQIKPNQAPNPAWNRLRYGLQHDTLTRQEVEELFAEGYGLIIETRHDRQVHGLKAVTRHGHEDLVAVQEGADVRPYNAATPNTELHDFMGRRRADRNRQDT
jgi:hypothetical protein